MAIDGFKALRKLVRHPKVQYPRDGVTPPPSDTPLEIGSSGMTPDAGSGPSLNGWSWSTMAPKDPWWAEFTRRVDSDPVSPYNDLMHGIFNTVPGGKLSTSWFGDLYNTAGAGNPLYGMPYNHVRGDIGMAAVGTIVYSNPGIDPATFPWQAGLSVESWPLYFPQVLVTNGSATVTGIGTTFTNPAATATSTPAAPTPSASRARRRSAPSPASTRTCA